MIDADLRLLRHVAEIAEREQIDVGRLLADLTALMRDHQLALPPDLALLFKAAISLEGLGRMLDIPGSTWFPKRCLSCSALQASAVHRAPSQKPE